MKTYGTIELRGDKWAVDPRPDVMIRLKRFFPRVSRRSHGRVLLTNTPDICRDLGWFLERFPMQWRRDADRLALDAAVAAHKERESLIDQLLAGVTDPHPFELALPPRDYQKIAADMTLMLGGLLLADDLGLGKTVSAIAVLTDPRARPALVVCPTQLPRQWEDQIRKFAPTLRTHILRKGTPYDIRKSKRTKANQLLLPTEAVPPDVIISNYHKLSGWAETLAPIVRCVVFDEVQELRRGTASNKGAAAQHIAEHASFRLGLTGTPIYNQGGEIWNVIQPLRPWSLGTRDEFHEEWCGYVDSHGRAPIKDPKAFGFFLRDQGLMLRRTRKEVGRELEPLSRVPHYIDCDSDRIKRIEGSAAELARVIMASKGDTERGEKFRASEELSNLVRQATGIAKAPYVAEFVRMIVEAGEQVLLYGWHREVYAIWLEKLRDLNPVMFTGSESASAKERAKQAFIAGDSKVLIMSLRSGAGLDGLQYCCRTIVHGELDWSSGVHEQCDGRVHRDGQTDPVLSYYLIAEDGSDPIVADVLGVKRAQLEGIRNPEQQLVEKLTGSSGDHIRRLAERYLRRKAA
jgi:SNF2 family DNA or RNA helicase